MRSSHGYQKLLYLECKRWVLTNETRIHQSSARSLHPMMPILFQSRRNTAVDAMTKHIAVNTISSFQSCCIWIRKYPAFDGKKCTQISRKEKFWFSVQSLNYVSRWKESCIWQFIDRFTNYESPRKVLSSLACNHWTWTRSRGLSYSGMRSVLAQDSIQ